MYRQTNRYDRRLSYCGVFTLALRDSSCRVLELYGVLLEQTSVVQYWPTASGNHTSSTLSLRSTVYSEDNGLVLTYDVSKYRVN